VISWLNYRIDSGFGKMDAEFAKINADLDRIDAKLGITSDKIEAK
jgi:hypothetical protein